MRCASSTALGCRTERVDITPMVDPMLATIDQPEEPTAGDVLNVRRGNVMARQRMIVLYDRSAAFDALVAGTSNKTEALLGYGTLYGDMAAAFAPIGDLYKTQLRGVADRPGRARARSWPSRRRPTCGRARPMRASSGARTTCSTARCSRWSTGAGPSIAAWRPASTATWWRGWRGEWRRWSSSASCRRSPRSRCARRASTTSIRGGARVRAAAGER